MGRIEKAIRVVAAVFSAIVCIVVLIGVPAVSNIVTDSRNGFAVLYWNKKVVVYDINGIPVSEIPTFKPDTGSVELAEMDNGVILYDIRGQIAERYSLEGKYISEDTSYDYEAGSYYANSSYSLIGGAEVMYRNVFGYESVVFVKDKAESLIYSNIGYLIFKFICVCAAFVFVNLTVHILIRDVKRNREQLRK